MTTHQPPLATQPKLDLSELNALILSEEYQTVLSDVTWKTEDNLQTGGQDAIALGMQLILETKIGSQERHLHYQNGKEGLPI